MSGKALGIAAVAMLAGGVLGYAARGGPAAAQEPAGRQQVEAFVTGQIGASVAQAGEFLAGLDPACEVTTDAAGRGNDFAVVVAYRC